MLTVLNISASLSVDVAAPLSRVIGVDVPLEVGAGAASDRTRGRQQMHFPPDWHLQGFKSASTKGQSRCQCLSK